jgi:beta-lactamase class A
MIYMKKFVILLCFLPLFANSQKTDRKLEHKIQEAISGFNGNIGIYIKNLKTGKIVAINADTVFPTASIVKVPILTGIMYKLAARELDYNQSVIYKDSLLYEGSDILGSFKNNESILLKKLIMLMLTTSDNTASLWLQSLAGTGTRVNAIMDTLGLHQTRINSRTPGREQFRTQNGWGQTTPREMASLFEMIWKNEIISSAVCERMMRVLGRNYWDENEAISQVPPTVEVFSKNGCVNASRNEILLVNAPNNPYIFSIFTKNNKDVSWKASNEAWALTRKISLLLWNHFEPRSDWKPSVN